MVRAPGVGLGFHESFYLTFFYIIVDISGLTAVKNIYPSMTFADLFSHFFSGLIGLPSWVRCDIDQSSVLQS
jgi:hypothetical protein